MKEWNEKWKKSRVNEQTEYMSKLVVEMNKQARAWWHTQNPSVWEAETGSQGFQVS